MTGAGGFRIDTPLGPLTLQARDDAVRALEWGAAGRADAQDGDALAREAARQLREYFAGGRRRFDLPLAPRGTPFQRTVWGAMSAIPYGATREYGEVAAALGSAPRAVGQACRRNPIAVVVPCHRIVGRGGPGGYAGRAGGKEVAVKRALLALEAGAAARR